MSTSVNKKLSNEISLNDYWKYLKSMEIFLPGDFERGGFENEDLDKYQIEEDSDLLATNNYSMEVATVLPDVKSKKRSNDDDSNPTCKRQCLQ